MPKEKISFKELLAQVRSDAGAEKGRFFSKFFDKFFHSNGFRLVLNYRLGRYFYLRGNRRICKWLKYRQVKHHSCQLSYKASIGKHIYFPHPISIVIGEGVVIGDHVKIWQQVTIGSHGKKGVKQAYPILENHVKVFSAATIIGGVRLGEGCTVGAISLVTRDVAPAATVAGIPARPIRKKAEN